MKPNDLVITTQDIDGIDEYSVGIIDSMCQTDVRIYFVGANKTVTVLSDSLSPINIDKENITVEATGEKYKRICNECYGLKNMNDKMSARCKKCRTRIAGKSMSVSEKRRMEEKRPQDRSVYKCPICEKRMIVGIRKRIIVADHDHYEGKGREWICHSCNSALGRFRDDISILEKAIDYLRRFECR